jgi:hypothetical protein
MSALIAGIDLSSKRIDAALIPLDPDDGSDAPPVTLRHFDLPIFKPASTTPAYRRVERCRVIRDEMLDLLYKVSFPSLAPEVGPVCHGRSLEESSHYGGYVRCLNTATRTLPVAGRLVSFCDYHGPFSAPPTPLDHAEVVHVCIEEPFGSVSRSTVLWEILGAILASIPPHIERDTIQTHEWRRIIWGDTRPSAFSEWKHLAIETVFRQAGVVMNEHEAEAYLIARACRIRLEKAVAT